ncbi:hypothetical protein ACIGHN_27135, partial [Acidovorax sp. NPDC077693]|uniref:hypothetical protein n=1 Tax=unclassified Acidovorax TaxID=2684926 RepID=UPI0037CAE7A6
GWQGLYQLLQNRAGHEEWVAFWIYAIIRDATSTLYLEERVCNEDTAPFSSVAWTTQRSEYSN